MYRSLFCLSRGGARGEILGRLTKKETGLEAKPVESCFGSKRKNFGWARGWGEAEKKETKEKGLCVLGSCAVSECCAAGRRREEGGGRKPRRACCCSMNST